MTSRCRTSSSIIGPSVGDPTEGTPARGLPAVSQPFSRGDARARIRCNRGPFRDIEASGTVDRRGLVDVARAADGRVTDHWGVFDRLSLYPPLLAVVVLGRTTSSTTSCWRTLGAATTNARRSRVCRTWRAGCSASTRRGERAASSTRSPPTLPGHVAPQQRSALQGRCTCTSRPTRRCGWVGRAETSDVDLLVDFEDGVGL